MEQLDYGKHTIEYVSERIDGIHERLNELTRVTVTNLVATNQSQAAEIERLKAELESERELKTRCLADLNGTQDEVMLLKAELEVMAKVADQATKNMTIEDNEIVIRIRHGNSAFVVGTQERRPELYAYLAGRGK